ncbi:aldolase [Caballeronia sordidicola]|uniref:Aldolase n=1 Tax=Caballeronia sordidicola TaxID=196367 RepID=A0A158GEI2_CABSO|nr:CoA ester lyase [Caballeronia sordidicola]SAL30039.1 aldolase [Caballeronia sordidicola]
MDATLIRSYLFVPATHPARFAKAAASGADAVIIDLEDAVSPDAKDDARNAACAFFDAGGHALLRVNAADTAWFAQDMALCASAGVTGIVLPKAEGARELDAVRNALHEAKPVLPIIETAAGIANAGSIAADPQTVRLLFGTVDFCLDLNVQGDGEELLFYRSLLVLASRLGGIDMPVDGPALSIHEPEALQRACEHARRIGFGGKLCIHPAQVADVNRCFSPSDAELEWAARVVDRAGSGAGAFSLDGKMVDAPVIERAARILSRARTA